MRLPTIVNRIGQMESQYVVAVLDCFTALASVDLGI